MVVGMTCVFVILTIVIYLGKAMIALTNRFPEETKETKNTTGASSVSDQTRSVIEAAVKELTGGKGSVKEIVKVQ